MHVPDGLAGERVDSAIARMLGLSRSRAADLIAQDLVQVVRGVHLDGTRGEPDEADGADDADDPAEAQP